MNRIRKSLMVVSVTALSLTALVPLASARGLGGFGGKAADATQESSFSEYWNAVVYNGSGTARWDVPLVIDALGTLNVTAYVYVNGVSSNVSCSTQSVGPDSMSKSNTVWVSPPVGNAWTSVFPGPVTGFVDGSLEISCFLGTGSKLQTVTW